MSEPMRSVPFSRAERFRAAIQQEHAHIHWNRSRQPEIHEVSTAGQEVSSHIQCSDATEEPWLRFTKHDYIGLALSGGGIRSATFNLGLLQGLARKGVLEKIDYLSTVSGGGYVGGFWTAWRQKHPEAGVFPGAEGTDTAEPGEVRHLREFSRFLMPRIGLTQPDMWGAIGEVLGGALLSLSLTIAVIITGMLGLGWLFGEIFATFLGPAGGLSALVGGGLFAAQLFALMAIWELRWQQREFAEAHRARNLRLWFLPGALAALAAAAACGWLVQWLQLPPLEESAFTAFRLLGAHPELALAPVGAYWATALALNLGRNLLTKPARRQPRIEQVLGAFRRCENRLAAFAATALILGLAWNAAVFLWGNATTLAGFVAGTVLGILCTIFGLAAKAFSAVGQTAQFSMRVIAALTRFLAPLATFNLLVVAMILALALDSLNSRLLLLLPLLVTLLLILLFDPERHGLHDFYRGRIARAYLGATATPARNRFSSEQRVETGHPEPTDDVPLFQAESPQEAKPKPLAGPIHLICCAVNDLGADPLPNLRRGSCSGVLSQFGFDLRGVRCRNRDVMLSSALTASAAAFNSQMGSKSVESGWCVGFMLAALNLRLGLWLPSPVAVEERAAGNPQAFRATLAASGVFLAELLQITSTADPYQVHLSDGGHFENLGLYELVRRHCRYIIVSDAGCDERVAFDDLGNAIRRVREDFGVEIDLDVSALQPDASGRSPQHMASGTIHFDGFEGFDKGTILYIKTSLTGDEPRDILQYHVRNQKFPHESTGDQFYDEAQWESYRRLGEHIAHSAFSFIVSKAEVSTWRAESIFWRAKVRWNSLPVETTARGLRLAQASREFELDLRQHGPAHLRAEFFPEAGLAVSAKPSGEEENAALFQLMQVVSLMEEAWAATRDGAYFTHHQAEGWRAYCERWAATPSFRRWWPALSAMTSPPFRRFAEDFFELGLGEMSQASLEEIARKPSQGATLAVRSHPLREFPAAGRSGLAARELHELRPLRWPELLAAGENTLVLEYLLTLDAQHTAQRVLQVGLAFVQLQPGNGPLEASWDDRDIFVPRAYVGSGVVARFLRRILDELQQRSVAAQRPGALFRVSIARPSAGRRDHIARTMLASRIDFYKSCGFNYTDLNDAAFVRLEYLMRPASG